MHQLYGLACKCTICRRLHGGTGGFIFPRVKARTCQAFYDLRFDLPLDVHSLAAWSDCGWSVEGVYAVSADKREVQYGVQYNTIVKMYVLRTQALKHSSTLLGLKLVKWASLMDVRLHRGIHGTHRGANQSTARQSRHRLLALCLCFSLLQGQRLAWRRLYSRSAEKPWASKRTWCH